MANKLVSIALRRLRADASILDLPTFLRAIGRSDLADISWESIGSSGTFATIVHEARRVIAKRNEADKEVKPLRPIPLTAYVLPWVDCGGRRAFRQFSLNPTKGWRSTTIDAADARAAKREGVAFLADSPRRRPGRASTYRRIA